MALLYSHGVAVAPVYFHHGVVARICLQVSFPGKLLVCGLAFKPSAFCGSAWGPQVRESTWAGYLKRKSRNPRSLALLVRLRVSGGSGYGDLLVLRVVNERP